MHNKQGRFAQTVRKVLSILIVLAISVFSWTGCALTPLAILTEDGSQTDAIILYEGQSILLKSSRQGEKQNWSVEDDKVADILLDGTLTAKKEGVTTVTLSSVFQTVTANIQVMPGRCAWTIGDSIFDYRDNGSEDMVQTIFNSSGYSTLCMDNLAGSTIRSARNMGIIDHIQSGMYENWDEPDLIVIFRGTNDAYFALNEPNVFKTNQTLEEAVEQICQYFRSLHPKAKIVWATPIYRADVPQKDLDQVRSTLYKICPQYQVGVFDLHMMGAFGKLNYDNNWQLLYDGIHLHDIGAAEMITCYQEYLRELDQ